MQNTSNILTTKNVDSPKTVMSAILKYLYIIGLIIEP